MISLLIWFALIPLNLILNTKRYVVEGLLVGQTYDRWELEKEIEVQHKILILFEDTLNTDPKNHIVYESAINGITKELNNLIAKRDGARKVKTLP